jgi:hypothetical protein
MLVNEPEQIRVYKQIQEFQVLKGRLAYAAVCPGGVLELLEQTYSSKKPDVYSKGDNYLTRLFCF